jgi:radical SAM superfamily enzyme YgiQ (UPF0313 family)
MMNVCLIAPPTVRIRYNISGVYPMPPLGLAYIAAVLEQNGFRVKIFDMPALKADWRQLLRYLEGENFSVYGLSCNIFNLKYAIGVADYIKKINSDSLVVVGGRCSAIPSEVILGYGKSLDVVVNGEGEKAMLDLCRLYSNKKSLNGAAGINGVSYRSNGKIIENKDVTFLELDSLPFPARHLLPNNLYRMHPPFNVYSPMTIMETSRGCAFNCSFCGLSAPVRERSVSNIIEEISELVRRYRIKEIHFVDPNFTYNLKRTEELCNQLIKKKIKVHWTCKTRVDLVSLQLLQAMARSGCYMISYGVESGRDKILNLFNKGICVENTRKAFEWTHKSGIRTLAYTIIGYPGEDDSDIRATKDLVKEIMPDFVLHNEFFLIPGSPKAKEYSAKNNLDYEQLINFYFKENSSDISRTRSSKYLKDANKEFYFRVEYIFKRLLKIKNYRDLMNMSAGLWYFLADKIRKRRIF